MARPRSDVLRAAPAPIKICQGQSGRLTVVYFLRILADLWDSHKSAKMRRGEVLDDLNMLSVIFALNEPAKVAVRWPRPSASCRCNGEINFWNRDRDSINIK